MSFSDEYGSLKNSFEVSLRNSLSPEGRDYGELIQAMNYSLMAGGKRIRPVMAMAFCVACGGEAAHALPAARAAEMIHTYSLIHDDLPCMDDDDLRRGKPTNHIVYGLCTATLAGDALQARAFFEICSSELPAEVKAECVRILSFAAGEEGMCAGQYLDMKPDYGKDLRQVEAIHMRKTSAMIGAACEMGVVAGGGSEEQRRAAQVYAEKVGLAFQIEDDLLDEFGDTKALGKNTGSDARGGKTTFLGLYGEEKCREMIGTLTAEAKKAVSGSFNRSEFLEELADMLAGRNY